MKSVRVLLIALSLPVNAGGYSSWAMPSEIEHVNNGILITGAFGNPDKYADSDKIFISRTNTSSDAIFDSLMSIVFTGFAAQKEVRFRAENCFNVTYHGQVVSGSRTAVYIRQN